MRLIPFVILAPHEALGPTHLDYSLLPGVVQQQPQRFLNQRMDTWTATPPGRLQGSFSALYQFTPDIGDTDNKEHHQGPPNQGASRTGDCNPR